MHPKKELKILLAESFKELVLEKLVEKITIKEITDRAGVTRVTFYNHFQDKYELLEWICREELVNPIRILLWNGMEKEAITFMFTSILKNREFYSHVVKLEGQNSFESIVKNCFTEALVEYITGHADSEKRKYKEMRPEWLAEFYSQGMSFVLISWIKGGMVEPGSKAEWWKSRRKWWKCMSLSPVILWLICQKNCKLQSINNV